MVQCVRHAAEVVVCKGHTSSACQHQSFFCGCRATEQAGLIITTHPAPQLADSHVVVGQVVRGHGSVRALQQVVTGKQYQVRANCSDCGLRLCLLTA